MASEVLVQFDEPHRADDGRDFVAHVCGQRIAGGLWEAWIEFHSVSTGEATRTGRETEQLSRGDLRYWAAGLTRTYLRSALRQALGHKAPPSEATASSVKSALPTVAEHTVLETNAMSRPLPVLDPFALHKQSGDYVLRQELRGLSATELRDIIAAFDIPDLDIIDIARTFEDALAERIVAGVQQVVGREPRIRSYPSTASKLE